MFTFGKSKPKSAKIKQFSEKRRKNCLFRLTKISFK
nr:MAG TPA_asm: hypothetical protein [Caudoviricetes sp.]